MGEGGGIRAVSGTLTAGITSPPAAVTQLMSHSGFSAVQNDGTMTRPAKLTVAKRHGDIAEIGHVANGASWLKKGKNPYY